MPKIDKIRLNNNDYDIGNNNTYSTDEQVIGTYMDKPLYRKIIVVDNPPKNTDNYLSFSSLSIEKITSIGGMAYVGTEMSFPVNFWAANTAYVMAHPDYTNSAIKYKNVNWSFTKIEFILEYTKTTDTVS